MAMPSADTDELARFGYKQELDRSLGMFSSWTWPAGPAWARV